MKTALKIYLIFVFSVAFNNITVAQHNLGTGDLNACSGTLYDSAGNGSDYSVSEDITETYCSTAGNCISITFTSFDVDNNYDFLYIYDGPTTGAALIGKYTGSTFPNGGTVISSTGCLTFRFTSDSFDDTNAGWSATISCGNCPGEEPCDPISITTSCGKKGLGDIRGSTSSGVSNPGCGNYQGGDLWFTLTIPASGKVNLEGKNVLSGINDVAMSAYTAASCSGSKNLQGCDDNSGDGNMPRLNLTGLTAGNILYVRMWNPGNTNTGAFELEVTNPESLFCLTDDATMYNFPADTCMQVTAATNSQKGCAWYQNTINFSQSFDHTLEVYCGNNDAGADGMTFTFHNDPEGSSVCGNDGQYLGAGGIRNAVVIEIDTYDNGGSQDIAEDHIAIWTSASGEGAPIAGAVSATSPASNIEDGTVHTMRIVWNAISNLMEVYFDGTLRLSVTNDFVNNIFGSNNVFWGSTGSTGGFNNQHYVCPPSTLILPIELIRFTSICSEGNVKLLWATASEINNDYYTIERSFDGVHFNKIGDLPGAGNSSQILEYNWMDKKPLSGTNYYRLKQTDFDGKFSYSDLKASTCKKGKNFSVYPNPFKNNFKIQFSEETGFPLTVEIHDYLGRIVYQKYIEYERAYIDVELNNRHKSGTYSLRIFNSLEYNVQKIIKLNK